MRTIELINDAIIPLELNDKVFLALKQMDENRISHLPVVVKNMFHGIISDDELLSAEDENMSIDECCKSFLRIYVNQYDHYYNALKVLMENKLSMVPVVDDEGFYLGALSGEDVLKETAEVLSVGNPGGIIVLHVNENDFSLSEITRIVESNDTKILSVGISSLPNSTVLQITLKLSRINIEPVIQTLTRYEYDINAYFGENEKDEDLLRDRYESLMLYLKM